MKVYRWEHKELGVGPLCGETDFPWSLYFEEHDGPWGFKEFEVFIDNKYDSDGNFGCYFFGTESLRGLRNLMSTGAYRALRDFGFCLSVYEVTEDFLVLSDGQVVFNKSKAVKIR